jgi:hypothetical protein
MADGRDEQLPNRRYPIRRATEPLQPSVGNNRVAQARMDE